MIVGPSGIGEMKVGKGRPLMSSRVKPAGKLGGAATSLQPNVASMAATNTDLHDRCMRASGECIEMSSPRTGKQQLLRCIHAISLIALVLGCSSASAGDRTTLRIWAMGREGEVLSQLMPAFEKSHPNIHVEVQQIPWTAAHEKLLTSYVGESTPDIAMLGNTWVPEFVALNSLEPL